MSSAARSGAGGSAGADGRASAPALSPHRGGAPVFRQGGPQAHPPARAAEAVQTVQAGGGVGTGEHAHRFPDAAARSCVRPAFIQHCHGADRAGFGGELQRQREHEKSAFAADFIQTGQVFQQQNPAPSSALLCSAWGGLSDEGRSMPSIRAAGGEAVRKLREQGQDVPEIAVRSLKTARRTRCAQHDIPCFHKRIVPRFPADLRLPAHVEQHAAAAEPFRAKPAAVRGSSSRCKGRSTWVPACRPVHSDQALNPSRPSSRIRCSSGRGSPG